MLRSVYFEGLEEDEYLRQVRQRNESGWLKDANEKLKRDLKEALDRERGWVGKVAVLKEDNNILLDKLAIYQQRIDSMYSDSVADSERNVTRITYLEKELKDLRETCDLLDRSLAKSEMKRYNLIEELAGKNIKMSGSHKYSEVNNQKEKEPY